MSSDFETFWKPFARVFQAICISHYSVFRPNISNSFRKKIPFLVYFIVLSSAHLTLIFTVTSKTSRESDSIALNFKESTLMNYVNALSIIGQIAIHSAIHLENVFYGDREQEICDRLKHIYDSFATNFNYVPDYEMRRVKYIYKTVLFFVLMFIFASASAFTPIPAACDDKFFMPPILIPSMIMTLGRWCQISLYLNIIADTTNDLQGLIRQQQINNFQEHNQPTQTYEEFKNMQCLRKIYSNIWFITTLVSQCFGWSFLTFLAKVVLELLNGSYWFFVNLSLHQSIGLNIRKFKQSK